MNEALESWADRVRVPHVYTLTWNSGTAEYTLPTYVNEPLRPQAYFGSGTVSTYNAATYDGPQMWQTLPGWETDTGGTAPVLRLPLGAADLNGRIVYYPANGPVPTTPATQSGTLAADGTALTIASAPDVADVGYVNVGGEWMSYAGVARGVSTTTLTLDGRGLESTTAASHASGGAVWWGVAVDDERMFGQLRNQMRALLHAMFLTDGAEHERANHERLMSFWQQRADMQLSQYVGQPDPVMKLTRLGVGAF